MNQSQLITPHPNFFETLFAHKSKVSTVFKDILGLYDISHFAIAQIDGQGKILTLSSTPALEFNLFNSNFWQFDQAYQFNWYSLCIPSFWESLYTNIHYDELYYLKQVKYQYSIGVSLAIKTADHHLIYSIATHKEGKQMREFFLSQAINFYKIGNYCSRALLPLLEEKSY